MLFVVVQNNYFLIIIFALFLKYFASASLTTSEATTLDFLINGTQNSTPLRYEAPDDCQWWIRESGRYSTEEEVALTCNLRTINSEFDTTNFSVIPPEHTTSLKIECNSDLLLKSSLNDKSFAHLTRLRELIIDYCKLDKWSSGTLTGLKDLRNLTVRTRNMEWPLVSFQLTPLSFNLVKQLERLDLSTNNIWSFPESIFCPLINLYFLNVSDNRLQNVGDLGFRERISTPAPPSLESKKTITPCNLDIRILDGSYNHFVLLPSYGFSALKRLQDLRVRNNQIAMVADRALSGLKHLRSLDLSNNKVVSLPMDLFLECADSITEINLQNNSISVLSPRLFANLNQLLSLDLSSNQLTSVWMNNETFSGLIRLVSLNLSRNQISKLDRTLFPDLYTLQVLNLEHNLLDSIPADTFTALNNLHTLILSYNRIVYLEANSLNGLYALGLLSLDNNKLESIHPESLKNCTALQDLNLNTNKFVIIPSALKDMRLLKTLDLGENSISNLDRPGFQGLVQLYGLRLIANQISSLTNQTLVNLPSLQIINLSQNRIKYIENGTFDKNLKLEAARLDSNLLTSVEGIFGNVKSLLWLNVSRNRITNFDYGSMPSGLQWLDLHGNLIENLSNERKNKSRIQTLDISFNKLQKISPNSIPDSVELLFLNDNNIASIEPHTFINKLNLSRVDLYANQLVSIELVALQLFEIEGNRPQPEFYIGGNPFQCDCSMEWLQRINKFTNRQHPVIMDLGNIYCHLVYNRGTQFLPLSEVASNQFLCPYKSHCYTLCRCCVFDACDCELNCPANCSCFHDESWSSNVVDCSSANYTSMPNKIPMDATEIYLDGNNFGELSNHSFIGRKNLDTLYANNSNIRIIHNYTFNGIKKLKTLHLEDNLMEILSGFEFNSLVGLKELYLQNNQIRIIDNRTFWSLKNLEILHLQNNKIRVFEVWQLISNPYLVQVALADNPWTCECQFVKEFRMWLHNNYLKVSDSEFVACFYDNSTKHLGTFLRKDSSNTSCISFFGSVAENQILQGYLSYFLLSTTIFIVIVFFSIAVFLYRKELNFCLYNRLKCLFCYSSSSFNDETYHDRLFDAYVAYSIKDEDFANQILCANLENSDTPYRLCLHYRDFNVNSYIADTIIEAAESSRRTILIISRNFLHTEWCRYEYKTALREVLKDRRNKTIFILLGELCQRDLDPDMKRYLKSNTCIQWGENLFWTKLKNVLPDYSKDHTGGRISINSSVTNSSNVYATPFSVSSSYYNSSNGRCLSLNIPNIVSNNERPPPYTSEPCYHYDNANYGYRNGTYSHGSLPKVMNTRVPWT